MKEQTYGRDIHGGEIHGGNIHGGDIRGGDIHRGDIHMKEQTYGETYTWWSVQRVECTQSRVYTRWRHTHGRTTEGTYTRREYTHDGINMRRV